jgi:hypothetical protein
LAVEFVNASIVLPSERVGVAAEPYEGVPLPYPNTPEALPAVIVVAPVTAIALKLVATPAIIAKAIAQSLVARTFRFISVSKGYGRKLDKHWSVHDQSLSR